MRQLAKHASKRTSSIDRNFAHSLTRSQILQAPQNGGEFNSFDKITRTAVLINDFTFWELWRCVLGAVSEGKGKECLSRF